MFGSRWVSGALCAAALLLSTGCGLIPSYPVVQAEAFRPKTKVAVIAFESEFVQGATLNLPIQVTGIDKAHAAFTKSLTEANFELLPVESVQGCPAYTQLPKQVIDLGSSAKGLERVVVHQHNAAGLAQCVGADIVVVVSARPVVQASTQIMGVGNSLVSMPTTVKAYDNTGKEIWIDYLRTESDTFANMGTMMDPKEVETAATKALTLAARQAVKRFNAKLQAPATATAEAK
jgi:hypothetical protein